MSEPTFRCEIIEDCGQPPWGFRLIVSNLSRRDLHLEKIRIAMPKGFLIWDEMGNNPGNISAIIRAAFRIRSASFVINRGIKGAPVLSTLCHHFYVSLAKDTPDIGRTITLPITVYWRYVDGSRKKQSISLDMPLALSG
jgi:hypothetical protein